MSLLEGIRFYIEYIQEDKNEEIKQLAKNAI